MYTRRDLVRALGFIPALQSQPDFLARINHRLLGRTGRWVTPLGLGGQASLQWTNRGIDPADIIVRAIGLGINYLDSANAYGPSQANYQTAVWRLHLSAADSEYNAAARERLYFATKTGQRYAFNRAQPSAATAITELRQSLTVMFGDGRGWVPDGAYLDAMQMHNVSADSQVDQIFEGMEDRAGVRKRDRIGALAGLLDFRDGTNYTGLNPDHRHWIRHIGITGHQSSAVLMRALRMDEANAIDTLLVALNANDRVYCSHQHNAIPLAVAKGLGVIAMKAFADGVFYGKPARFSNNAADVVLSVGRPGAVEPADLVRYPLSVPGVGVLITGIGAVDQLPANFDAALADVASEAERRRIESTVADLHGVGTNYFQDRRGLTQPPEPKAVRDADRVTIQWTTAYAGPDPIRSYRIYSGDQLLLSVPFRPQTTTAPLAVTLPAEEAGEGPFRVVASTTAS
jgi:aryl-alcohol dehydrogenase-like predicted oxidoreductase